MSTQWFPNGLEGFGAGSVDWDADTFDCVALLLDGSLTDTAVKAITAASNATPIVITSNSHGFSNGDIVVIRGVGGNTAANGTWAVASQATNTFALTTVKDGLNSTGNGAYTSGGCAIDLTLADFNDDIDGAFVGSPSTDIATKTNTDGTLDGDDVTFSSFTGTAHAIVVRLDTGTASTARNLVFNDGMMQVIVAADAASSATTLWVEKLPAAIASGATMIFSNGITATTSSSAALGARSISVNALSGAIAAGHTADVVSSTAGVPFTTTNGNVSIQWSNGLNKIATL